MNQPNDPVDPTDRPRDDAPRLKIRSVTGPDGSPNRPGYFLLRDGKQQGPFTRDAVVSLIQSAHSSPMDLAWAEGQTGWRPLGELFPGVRPLVRPPQPLDDDPTIERSEVVAFTRNVIPSLIYPFRGDGFIIMGIGTVVYFVVSLAFGMLGLLSTILYILVMGYFLGALQLVIHASAKGETDLPKWPELETGWRDVVHPFRLWASCGLLCFSPAFLMFFLSRAQASDTLFGTGIAFMLGGFVYYPMALLAVAMADSVEAMNPLLVLRSIQLVFKDYLLLVLVLAIVVGTYVFGLVAIEQGALRLVQKFWSAANFLYFGLIQARLLGVFYHSNQEKLGWF